MDAESLGDRMKRYEAVGQHRLMPRSSVIIRVDGRAFHTFTREAERPFDAAVIAAMTAATHATAAEMQDFRLAYTQSDEASFLLRGPDDPGARLEAWYGYSLAKLVSISASLFTAHFNAAYPLDRLATFDSRAFSVPDDEAPNVFVWRQRDWERNSLSMFARSHFSHAELLGRGTVEVHELLHLRGENWAHLPDRLKNGTFVLPRGGEVCDRLGYAEIAALIAGTA